MFLSSTGLGSCSTFPLFAALFTWYLAIGLQDDLGAQAPERLDRKAPFLAFAGLIFVGSVILFVIDIPIFDALTNPKLIRLH